MSKLKRALSKHKSRAIGRNEDSKNVTNTPRQSHKQKKRRRLSMQQEELLDARQMTHSQIDAKYGMELCRLTRGQVVGSLSLIRNSKRLVTAVARGTMAVVVAIPKSVVGQCFKKIDRSKEDDVDFDVMLAVGPQSGGRGGRGRRKNSLWMSGGEKQGVTEVENLSNMMQENDKLILSAKSATSSHSHKKNVNDGRMSLFKRAGARLSLFGRRTKGRKTSITKRSSSVHQEKLPAKRLSLSRKARKSLTKAKTDRQPLVEKSKLSYVEGFGESKDSSSDNEGFAEEKSSSADESPPDKLAKKKSGKKGRRVSMTDMIVSGLNMERSRSFVEINRDNIRRMEAALCKEASALAAMIYLRTYFLTMDHDEMLDHFQNGRFVRVPDNTTVVLKDSAIILTGVVSSPKDLTTIDGRVTYVKVDKEMHDSIEICVECDVDGNPPRILVLPDDDSNSNMVTTALSMTEGDEEELGPPEEQRSKRSRVFSFFRDKSKKGSE